MTEFTVEITSRSLGVKLSNFGSHIGIHEVKADSIGDKLGLIPGDVLISINESSVIDMRSDKALNLFRIQQLPFSATFERFISRSPSSNEDYTICINDPKRGLSEQSSLALIDELSSSYDIEQELFEFGLNSPSVKVEPSSNCYESSESQLDTESDAESVINCAQYGFSRSGNKPNKIIKPFYHITPHDRQLSLELPDLPQHKDGDDSTYDDLFDYAYIDINTKLVTNGFLRSIKDIDSMECRDIRNLTAIYLYDNTVLFREELVKINQCGNERALIISDNGFNYGVHSWSIQVKSCDVYLQEIGVISTHYDDIDFESLLETGNGIRDASELGARAVYGNELLSCTNYYASYNDDDKPRCDKDLSKLEIHKIGWCQGDVIKCELNLRTNYIRFYLNGKKVRKLISLQNNKTWYPVICYSGNCRFQLIDYE